MRIAAISRALAFMLSIGGGMTIGVNLRIDLTHRDALAMEA